MTIQNISEIQEKNIEQQLIYTSYLTISDPNATQQQINDILAKAQKVDMLILKSMPLEELPSGLATLPNLDTLTIEVSSLKNLNILKSCRKLRSFRFSGVELPIITGSTEDLPNLESLDLNVVTMTHIPEYFCLPSIKVLHLQSNVMTVLSSDLLDRMLNLYILSVNAPLKRLPVFYKNKGLNYLRYENTQIDSWSGSDSWPSSVEEIVIHDDQLVGSGPAFHQMPVLKRLSIGKSCSEQWLAGINHCKQLEDLRVVGLSCLPDTLQECTTLKYLNIDMGILSILPEWFCLLTQLTRISITNTHLKDVPSDWSAMKSLETVSLYKNEIEDFRFAYTIPELKTISIDDNPISDRFFMLDGKKILPVSEYSSFATHFLGKGSNYKDWLQLMSALGKSGLNREDKTWFFEEIQPQKKIQIPDKWPLFRLIQGLCIPFKPLLDKLQGALINHPLNNDNVSSMQSGKLWICGDFAQKKTEIKNKLDKLSIALTSQFDDTVTHIALGKKPEEAWTVIQQKECAFLLEHQLYQIIKVVDSDEKFLVQEEIAGGQQMADGIRQLLVGKDNASVLLALEMLKTGGIPSHIMDELLLVQKTSSDAKVRAEAKKILQTQGSLEWINVLSDKQSFTNLEKTKEKEVRTKLEKMAKSVSKERVAEFGLLLFAHYQKGLSYLLAHCRVGSDYRIRAMHALTQGDHFDFHIGVGYNNWKTVKPEAVILSPVKTGITFPYDHPEPAKVRVMNLHNTKFATIAKEISVFENLEELDCSANSLKSLPLEIGKLAKLKRLDLSLNRFSSLPAGILKLKNLEWLDLRYNNDSVFKDTEQLKIELPENFKELLPKCEVLI